MYIHARVSRRTSLFYAAGPSQCSADVNAVIIITYYFVCIRQNQGSLNFTQRTAEVLQTVIINLLINRLSTRCFVD